MKLTSFGPHDLSDQMFMMCIPHILDPILYILNCSLSSEIFPSLWKRSIVIPIYNPTSSSFRPISLPLFLSKLLERICFSQFNSFFSKRKGISTFQSGFRKLHSTTTALLHIADLVLHSFDRILLPILIVLDFSKAFDTINHEFFLFLICCIYGCCIYILGVYT